MINKIIRYLISFILLVTVQVIFLNNMQLSGLFNPFLYVLFILILPFEIPGILLLVLSMLIGLTVDMFLNTPGMNAAASLMIGFIRPYFLKLMAPRDGYEFESTPTLRHMGFRWFITYASFMVLVHHFTLFFIEIGRFNEFFFTFSKVILSSFLTIILILIVQYLFSKQKGKK